MGFGARPASVESAANVFLDIVFNPRTNTMDSDGEQNHWSRFHPLDSLSASSSPPGLPRLAPQARYVGLSRCKSLFPAMEKRRSIGFVIDVVRRMSQSCQQAEQRAARRSGHTYGWVLHSVVDLLLAMLCAMLRSRTLL
jgi:hypothetical protein